MIKNSVIAQPLSTYDLVWDSTDSNGFPLNPRWGKQELYRLSTGKTDYWNPQALPDIHKDCLNFAKKPGCNLYDHYNVFNHTPECTTQPTFLDNTWMGKCPPSPFVWDYHISGHVNWRTVTYEGPVVWEVGDAWWINPDTDWTSNLYPQGSSGSTESDGRIHLEWSPSEIGNHFNHDWWKLFHDKVKEGFRVGDTVFSDPRTRRAQEQTVGPLINRKKAIAIGLLGLDMGHDGGGAELHPTFGFAVHAGGTKAPNSLDLREAGTDWDKPENLNDDLWALFFINWGEEGYCSSGNDHELNINSIAFHIPWVAGMKSVEVLNTSRFFGEAENKKSLTQAGWRIEIDEKKPGLLVYLSLPPASERAKIYGELHLKWFSR